MEATIGGYRLLEKVGHGGFGTVWRGESPGGAEVALKMMHADLVGEGESHARMINEFSVLTRLNHQHIVRVHSVLSHEDRLVLVMDFVRGRTLTAELARRGTLPMGEALTLMAQVSSAMVCAHGAGIVHRDLKPDNVLVDSSGSARLVDFGIALAAGSSRHTGTGLVVGTASYVAPELIRGAEPGPASDVYAIGLLAAECVTGRRVFDGTNTAEVFNRQLTESPSLPVGWPPELTALIAACLEKEPANRPSAGQAERVFADLVPSAGNVNTVLLGSPTVPERRHTLAAEAPQLTEPSTGPPPATAPSARRPVGAWWALLGVLLVGAVVITTWLGNTRTSAGGRAGGGGVTAATTVTTVVSGTGTVTGTTSAGSASTAVPSGTSSPAASSSHLGTAEQGDPTANPPLDAPPPGPGDDPQPAPPPSRTPESFVNDTDVTIRDNEPSSFRGTVMDVVVPDEVRAGAPGVRVIVNMKIVHERRGDLTVRLHSPDGRRMTLVHADPVDIGRDLIRTIDVTDLLNPESSLSGTWRFTVSDSAEGATGRLDSWSIVV